MNFLKSLTFGFLLVSAFNLQAEDKSRGCGPASWVAPKNTMLSTSTRATTDTYLFPLNWSATSSGTSNCKKHEIVENQEKAHHFLVNNYDDLKNEIAIGRGEYLGSFAQALGCTKNEASVFSHTLKENYERIFPSSNLESDEFFDNVVNLLKQNLYLKQKCKNIAS